MQFFVTIFLWNSKPFKTASAGAHQIWTQIFDQDDFYYIKIKWNENLNFNIKFVNSRLENFKTWLLFLI